jgi:mono/diheme cytochrome c family protein
MRDSRWWSGVWGCLLAPVLIGMPLTAWAAEAKPAIKDIMTAAHKKPKELLKKAATGKASDGEKAELVKLYEALAAQRPPRGEAASWAEKTKALVAAAKAVAEGKAGAGDELTRVANCAACHEAHK